MIYMEPVYAFISAAFGGGLLVFFQFLITRHDTKKGHIASFQEKLDSLSLKIDVAEVKSLRRFILKFDHEIRHGERHTREEWDQAIEDVTDYKRYCRQHAEYINDKCNIAIETITETFKQVSKENDFEE